jgi:hypothetical protein
MKLYRQLQLGDTVGLLNLHDAYPKIGVIRHIGNNIVAVHQTRGALPFHNLAVEDQTFWVTKASVFDPQSFCGWLKALWYATRKGSS